MSATYDICCTQCHQGIWIGQSTNREVPFCFYSGEPDTMELLRVFLWTHRNHSLIFEEDQTLEL